MNYKKKLSLLIIMSIILAPIMQAAPWWQPSLKKAALITTAGAAIGTLGYLGYKAMQPNGVTALKNAAAQKWQQCKKWWTGSQHDEENQITDRLDNARSRFHQLVKTVSEDSKELLTNAARSPLPPPSGGKENIAPSEKNDNGKTDTYEYYPFQKKETSDNTYSIENKIVSYTQQQNADTTSHETSLNINQSALPGQNDDFLGTSTANLLQGSNLPSGINPLLYSAFPSMHNNNSQSPQSPLVTQAYTHEEKRTSPDIDTKRTILRLKPLSLALQSTVETVGPLCQNSIDYAQKEKLRWILKGITELQAEINQLIIDHDTNESLEQWEMFIYTLPFKLQQFIEELKPLQESADKELMKLKKDNLSYAQIADLMHRIDLNGSQLLEGNSLGDCLRTLQAHKVALDTKN